MGKKLAILILAFFVTLFAMSLGLGAETVRQTLLRDGFILTGVDSKLVSNDRWLFEFDSDVSVGKAVVKTGTRLELLPSAALERIIADSNNRSDPNYRLWGRVTKYKGENFIFTTYFLRLSKTKKPQALTSQSSQQQQAEVTINEPNDVLAIPQEIIGKLATKRITTMKRPDSETMERPTVQPSSRPAFQQDFILADRTGFIVEQLQIANRKSQIVFIPDGLGRDVPKISFRLLPCQALELTEQRQSAQPDTLRFKIAGIVTEYKGEQYLLLQKATRIYSHGNFN